MNRRRFLALTGLVAGLGATQAASGGGLAPDARNEAQKRSVQNGKPLLIAWMPKDPAAAHERGLLWAQLLHSGSQRHVAQLALCEVVFAEPNDDESERAKAAIATLVLHGRQPEVDVPMPVLDRSGPWPSSMNAADLLGNALEAELLPKKGDFDRWTEHFRFLDEDVDGSIRSVGAYWALGDLAGMRPRLGLVDQFAFELWMESLRSEEKAKLWIPYLERAALARLYDVDPPGARWQEDFGDPCPPCGMAVIPPTSRLFLEHYTR